MRVRWLFLLLPLLLAEVATAAPEAAGLYNEGNALYRSGSFEPARRKYLQAVATGVRDPRLFYNLGNACFKTGHLGEAALWYERARRLDPRDDDLAANIRFVNAVKQDREPEETNPLWGSVVAAFEYPTLNEISVVFAVFVLLGVGLLAWRVLRGASRGAIWLALSLGTGTVIGVTALFLAARVYDQERRIEAVIVAREATARSGPDAAQTAVFVVHEGTRVQVARREAGWALVRLGSGLGGWLPADALVVI